MAVPPQNVLKFSKAEAKLPRLTVRVLILISRQHPVRSYEMTNIPGKDKGSHQLNKEKIRKQNRRRREKKFAD